MQVVRLQRENVASKKEIETLSEQYKTASEQLVETQNLLERTRQPYHYLVGMVQQRDKDIRHQVKLTEALQKDAVYVRLSA